MNRLPCVPYPVKKLACALATISIIPTLWAAPEQGQIIGGQGSIDQQGKNTLIQQASDRLSINWQNFDIKSDERVQFIQPTESSIAFNRILSNKGSLIQGRIDANGQVVLINPNGIIFTETASVNVGALVASGLDINNEEFLNSEFTLQAMQGTGGQVINSGLLNAATGGSINLLGQQVENNGLISAHLGSVTLAAGKEAVLTFERDGLIGVRVSEAVLQADLGVNAAIVNKGEFPPRAARFYVSKNIFSQAVNVGELSQAKSAVVNADGSFSLGAGADVVNSGAINVGAGAAVLVGENISHTGQINADNAAGNAGSIELNAAQTNLIQGKSRLSAKASDQGSGGDIKILGQQVGLLNEAQVDASGAEGGGQILIGGDKTGANPLIKNAEFTYIDEQAEVRSDGLQAGSGGKLIVFAADSATIDGHLSARGGSLGDGGFVETSGLQGLAVEQAPDISAPGGLAGHWLIDPYNIEIVNSAVVRPDRISTSNTYTNSILTKAIFTSRNDTAQIGWNTIRNVLDNGSGGTVEIKTSGGSNAGGTIKVAANFDFSSLRSSAPQSGFNSTLILTADKNIDFTDSVTYLRASAYNRLNMEFNAQSGINFNRASLTTNGGNLSARTQDGAITSKASLNTARSGETNNNSGKIQLSTATGSIALNTVISAGTSVFSSNGRGGNAGAIDIQAQGNINISGTLSNTAGYSRANIARQGAGATLNLSAANITTQAINTSANSTSITAKEQVNLGAFNSTSNCTGQCSGDLIVNAAPMSAGINLAQSAAWQVKGATQLNLGTAGQANLPQVNNQFDARNSGKTLGITADSAIINSRADVHLTDSRVNSLALHTLGNLNQAAGSRIYVSGDASLSAENINLSEANNDWAVLHNLTGVNSVALSDLNGLVIDGLDTPLLTLSTPAETALSGALRLRNTTLITQHGPGGLRLNGGISRTGTGELQLRATAPGAPLITAGAEDTLWHLSADNQGTLAIKDEYFGQFAGFSALIAMGSGQNVLSGADQDNLWRIFGNATGSIGAVRFSGMSHLQGGAAADRFELQHNSDTSVLTYDGGEGEDTLVNNWLPLNSWHMTGENQGYIYGAAETLRVKAFANIEHLQGLGDRLYGPEGDNQWAISATNSGSLNTQLSFSGMAELIGGSGSDRFAFSDGKFITEVISGGAGVDEVVAAATDWSVSAQGSGFFAYPNSTARQSFRNLEVLTSTAPGTLTGPAEGGTWRIRGNNSVAIGNLTFNGMTSLKGNSGADRFELQRDSDTTVLTINGGEGRDELVNNWLPFNTWYITGANEGYVSGAQSRLRVKGFADIERIQGYDDRLRGPDADNQWDITATNGGLLNGALTFAGFTELRGGAGSDHFKITAGKYITEGIFGGAGADDLSVRESTSESSGNAWTITDAGRGNLAFDYLNRFNQQAFYEIETLRGAEAADIFRVRRTGIAMTLDGGANYDQVEFTGQQDITLGQPNSQGTNLINIESLSGDPLTENTLRSASSGGQWELQPGHLTSAGLAVDFSNFSHLIGGGDGDHNPLSVSPTHNALILREGEYSGQIIFGDSHIEFDNISLLQPIQVD